MRKKKHYLGQRRRRTFYGRDVDTFKWAVPRMLRAYYARKHREYVRRVSRKIINSSMYGAHAPRSVLPRKLVLNSTYRAHVPESTPLFDKSMYLQDTD